PRDVQLKECEFDEWPDISKVRVHDIRFHTPIDEYAQKMGDISSLLAGAKKPVLFCGGGCNSSEASAGIQGFINNYELPVVTSLMGLGCIPNDSPSFIGMVGMHGSYAANVAMNEADVVIAAGVRFDDRATGLVSKFCPNAKIIHIDVDAAEVDKILEASISVVADVESVFPVLAQLVSEKKIKAEGGWLKKIQKLKTENYSVENGRPKNEKLTNPRELIAKLPEYAAYSGLNQSDLIVTTDVGQHQMWAAQYYPVDRPRSFLTSGSLGTMGFGLPAAIGAALANPEKRIVCISGDGSIMMNIQELATLRELNLGVTVIVLQNGTLGMVYQQQKYLFDKNYSASVFDQNPDLLAIAAGFGIETVDADTDPEWYKKAFDCKRANKPCFVRCSVDSEENVLPFVPGGRANIDAIRN
ncbi:MAG: acetolactate synthase large subunit, partial [Treponema sp.]|nr:acetolactate synthase large subunit [Treponema sp.]